MKYIKKPVTIEAVQWKGNNYKEIQAFIGDNLDYELVWKFGKSPEKFLILHTFEGNHLVTLNDYIIKKSNDKFYPCEPDIFEQIYELVGE